MNKIFPRWDVLVSANVCIQTLAVFNVCFGNESLTLKNKCDVNIHDIFRKISIVTEV